MDTTGQQAADALAQRGVGTWLGRHWEFLAYLALVSLALGMRLWDLGSRAMHHDESLHAVYSWYLATGRGYEHDPMMHGPFQFFGNALVFKLFGDGDYTARLLYALFGTALVALPYLARDLLGRTGALVTSAMLALSPTMLYFSRFARNDIYMAVWVLALVIVVWRYLYSPRLRHLLIAAALLALAFSTKETAFLMVAVLGSFLFLIAIPDTVPWLTGRTRLSEFSAAGVLLLLFATLLLPQWAALISVGQKAMGLTLANPDWAKGPVGAPTGTGLYVAGATVVVLVGVSAALGAAWNIRVWPFLALVFYGIWLFLYTTFFTNTSGALSGIWQSLGYWLAQQDVQRGGQPWYYYFVTGGTYEFLAFGFAVAGGVYYLVKGDMFDKFLVYWAGLTFVLYSLAGEKMPWLLVNVALPLIVLGGKFLGHLVETIPWRRVARRGGVLLLGLVPLAVVLLLRDVLLVLRDQQFYRDATFWFFLVAGGFLGLFGAYLVRQSGRAAGLALAGLGVALLLAPVTVQASVRATYQNGDTPVEMLVYTQTAPDIPRLMRRIEQMAKDTGKGKDIPIIVDGTDGFTWPWVWYLRDYRRVQYTCLSRDSGCRPLGAPPQADVVLLNLRSKTDNAQQLTAYEPVLEYKHRWWFPESYRGLSPAQVADSLGTRKGWSGPLDYFLFRSLGNKLGSMDAVAYFPRGYVPGARVGGQ